MTYLDILSAQLEIDEGRRYVPYKDQFGNVTFGVGHNAKVPLSDAAVNQIKADDMAVAEMGARTLFTGFDALSDARKAVVVNMVFQMGEEREAQFTTFIGLVNTLQFSAAADDMLTTLWAKETPERAQRLSDAMRTG
jgi:lysozyme